MPNKAGNRKKYSPKRTPKLTETLKKGLRILNEHMQRHEDLMYSDEVRAKDFVFDPQMAKQGEDLVKAANSLAQMYLKIQADQRQMAEMMSIEEKIEAFLEWAQSLGRNQWYDLLRGFRKIEYDKDQEYTKGKGSDAVPKPGS